jgi:hypothetical protein
MPDTALVPSRACLLRRPKREIKRKHGSRISDLKENWEGNVGDFSFTAQGFNISGNLEVDSSTVKLTGKIPLALSLFKGQICKTIYEEGSKVLS